MALIYTAPDTCVFGAVLGSSEVWLYSVLTNHTCWTLRLMGAVSPEVDHGLPSVICDKHSVSHDYLWLETI